MRNVAFDTVGDGQGTTCIVAFSRHVTKGFFWIPGKMPGLNELLAASRTMITTKSGKRMYAGGSIKKATEQKVFLCARRASFFAPGAGFWSYLFVEPDRRRDPSNVSAGAVKIIEDALVRGQLAPGDGWTSVLGIATHFLHDKANEGVLVAWDARINYQRIEMLQMYDDLKG